MGISAVVPLVGDLYFWGKTKNVSGIEERSSPFFFRLRDLGAGSSSCSSSSKYLSSSSSALETPRRLFRMPRSSRSLFPARTIPGCSSCSSFWSCCKALGAPGSAGQTGKLAEQDILISAITARGFGSLGTKNEKSRGAADQDQRNHRLNVCGAPCSCLFS